MSGVRGWWIYAGLLFVAAAMAIASTQQATSASVAASIRNSGPAGIRALYLYLKESGFRVMQEDESLTQIGEEIETLVISAPSLRQFEDSELLAVRAFVEGGGTLVYLAPRPFGMAQSALDHWLHLDEGEWLSPQSVQLRDLSGASASAEVWLPREVNLGIERLVVSREPGVELRSTQALPLAGNARATCAWWRQVGTGEVWVFAGADVAENRRIELGDNLRLWEVLAARGPMLFDESHHHVSSAPSGAASRALWVVAGQFLACALVFSYARGIRLGPPRPEIIERHRSTREYLDSIAWLTRRAGVEKELLREASSHLRIAMQERLGIQPSLPVPDAARALQEHTQIPVERFMELFDQVEAALASSSVSPRVYAQIARQCAQLERIIAGRARG